MSSSLNAIISPWSYSRFAVRLGAQPHGGEGDSITVERTFDQFGMEFARLGRETSFKQVITYRGKPLDRDLPIHNICQLRTLNCAGSVSRIGSRGIFWW